MKAILFDFDGVLVNTLPMCFEINREKNPNFTFEQYQDMSNGNFYVSYVEHSAKGLYVAHDDYHKQYAKHLIQYQVPEELKRLIIELKDKFLLAIITSGDTSAISTLLEKENIRSYFSELLGYDFHTDKTHKILHVLKQYSIEPHNTVFITDTLGDILEAEKAGVSAIAVTWGLHDRDRLKKGKPITIVDTVGELETKIKEVL